MPSFSVCLQNSLKYLITIIFLIGAAQIARADITLPMPDPDQIKRIELNGYEQLEELYESLDYTRQSWQDGKREVPRLFLQTIPERWRSEISDQVTVATKKRIFFRTLGPLALLANEEIEFQRAALEKAISDGDNTVITELATQYRVDGAPGDSTTIAELRKRINPVPPSLVLAQMAIESGWATSRFAALGNALFGQWTYDGEGITPEQQRTHLGDYKIASFRTPFGSVRAYLLNLNTHNAYADLRDMRASDIAANRQSTGMELAEALIRYSERGEEYVKEVQAVIRQNSLQEVDNAVLEGPYYHLIPIGATAQ
ncbi:glucosaminidase domain-containing protein [Thalassospira xianhensis]|uniref:glucosaminidase domain-containing protein n=1 Tax=Thalassospira xianhensis TaxID=478503 RepID=UPI000DEE058E|nr:glucosaminidase domain-containing protein [Thalassospira xianhensis]